MKKPRLRDKPCVPASLRDPKPEAARPALVPKLRFPEFRGGEGWKEETGNALFNQINDRNSEPSLPILAITQEHGAIPRHMIDYHVAVTDKSIESYKVVQVGDFIISLRSFQGGIEYSRYHGICSPAYVILRRRGKNRADYFRHYLKTDRFVRILTKNLEGLRDGKMISYAQFSELSLPVPKPDEQQKIAECLSSVEEVIAAQSQKVAALKTHKKGLMQQLFPGEGETQPRLRFPEFQNAREWEKTELGHCIEKVIDYRGKPPPKAESGVPLITAKNVRFGWLDMTSDEYIEADAYDDWMSKGSPKAGDILFTTEAPLGNVALFPSVGKFALGQRIITLRCKTERCVPEFLFQSLLGPAMQKTIDFHSSGSTAKGIKSSVFVTLSFLHPNVDEQQRIATCLNSLDALISAEIQKLEALKGHKRGLMQQLFPSSEEPAA
jgi:type I restriction enzyme S subunit